MEANKPKLYLSTVNKEFLKKLTQNHPEVAKLISRVALYHMGDFLMFSCLFKSDAQKLRDFLLRSYSSLQPILGEYNISIVSRDEVAKRFKIEYTISSEEIRPDTMTTQTLVTEVTQYKVADFVEPIKKVLPDATDEEILSAPLSVSTLAAIASDVAAQRLRADLQGTVEPKTEPVCSTPALVIEDNTESNPPEEKKSPSAILKAMGLPFHINKIAKLIPSAKPPGKVTEASAKKELKDIKVFIQSALEELTPNQDKRIYVLKHIADESEAGDIYLGSLAKAYKIFDVNDPLKQSRRGKLVEAAKLMLSESPAT